MKRDTNRKITVEDLLRLKAAERPPAEFWTRFESEMRAKQLAAIVGKRSWWDGAPRIVALLYRRSISFGAVAALALAWLGARYLDGPALDPTVSLQQGVGRRVAAQKAAVQAPRVAPAENISRVETVAAESAPVPTVAADASHVTQVPATVVTEAPARTPFADGVSITLADYRQVSPDSVQKSGFGSDRDFEPAVATARPQDSDPLSRLDPSAERRARLLDPALPAYSAARSVAGDWMKERFSNARMYESLDPYGSSGSSMVGFRF